MGGGGAAVADFGFMADTGCIPGAVSSGFLPVLSDKYASELLKFSISVAW
jgi:hypothetical protein